MTLPLRGLPLFRRRYRAHVHVTIEYTNGHIAYRHASADSSLSRLKRRLRAQYAHRCGVKGIRLGNGWYALP